MPDRIGIAVIGPAYIRDVAAPRIEEPSHPLDVKDLGHLVSRPPSIPVILSARLLDRGLERRSNKRLSYGRRPPRQLHFSGDGAAQGVAMDQAMDEVLFEDACGQAEAIRSRRVTPAELVDAYLDRIKRFDPVVRAFVSVAADAGLQAAAADDPPVHDRPFDGVTVSIKDVEDVAGLPTTHSCQALAGNVAAEDGPLTRRLRQGGFVVLGKTNVPEFCSDMTTLQAERPVP